MGMQPLTQPLTQPQLFNHTSPKKQKPCPMSNSAESLTSHATSHAISHATCQATSAFQPYFPSNKTKPCLINFSQKLNLSHNLSHNLSGSHRFSTILPLEKIKT